ncbi:hypothetical protein BHE74_00024056 [Ensete ventricosum]|nr:hypothetical protein BHE74_00024056 [Ensete ventricosum]
MAERQQLVEPEEQVDLDGDNDIEEEEEDMMDDEDPVEEEDNGYRKAREEFGEEDEEERSYGADDDNDEDGVGDGRSEKVPTLEGVNDDAPEAVEGGGGQEEEEEEVEKHVEAEDDEDSRKRAKLLALPPHGSEVFIGGLPRDASEEDLRELAEPFGDIFESLAEDELRKILEDSGPGVEHIEMFKAIYVKNLPENVSSERLKELFERNGEVTKVVLPPAKAGQGKRDFGFVHFADRCVKYLVSLAKPQADKKPEHAAKPGIIPNLPSYPPYGYSGDPYGAYGGGYGAAGFVAVLVKAEVGGEAMETVDAATALTDSVVILRNAMRAKFA